MTHIEYINKMSRFKYLLTKGIGHYTAYYLVFNKQYEEATENEKEIVGIIDGDVWCGVAPKIDDDLQTQNS